MLPNNNIDVYLLNVVVFYGIFVEECNEKADSTCNGNIICGMRR